MSIDLDNILSKFGKSTETEEIPEPGTPDNPWIGFERLVNGTKQFHALSGRERRQYLRAAARREAREQAKGQRAYNRQQRKIEFDKGTVRMQLGILTGDIEASPAMKANLTAHIESQHKLLERKEAAPERRAAKLARREERLRQRRLARLEGGTATPRDLLSAFGQQYLIEQL